MRRKKYKRRGKKNTQTLILLLSIGFVIVVIIAVALYQTQPSQPKQEADEYFEIFDPVPIWFDVRENGSVLILYEISFKLKAVGGDAHLVIIQSWAMGEPQELGTILEGDFKEVTLSSPDGYLSVKMEGKFPVSIRIGSTEAEGKITTYL